VNQAVLVYLNPEQVEVDICWAEELEQRRGLRSELDEMWAYVAKKANPRWLWHAIDHHSPSSRGLSEQGVFFLRPVLYHSPRSRVGIPLGGGLRQKVSEMGGHQRLYRAQG
jgi:hypothetical protein